MFDLDKKYKILACCGCGNGTCTILAMKLRNVTKRMGMKAVVEAAPASVGISQGAQYDIIVCNQNLVSNFKKAADQGSIVIGLKNIMSEAEIEEKMTGAL